MFWVCGTPGQPDRIVESDSRPKSIYDGGEFDSTSEGFATMAELHARMGMIETCVSCGGRINIAYMEPTKSRLIANSTCFTCDHWLRRIGMAASPQSAIVDGHAYWIGEETDAPPSCRGFGGQRYQINFFDGRTVFTTNLWYGGEIPERFRDRLPDNAKRSAVEPA